MSTYSPQARDCNEVVDRMVFEGLGEMTPLARLGLAVRVSQALHRLSVAGLRQRYPDAEDEELSRRAGALRLGRELARMAFGAEAEAWFD